jgi:hypothetical protein
MRELSGGSISLVHCHTERIYRAIELVPTVVNDHLKSKQLFARASNLRVSVAPLRRIG